MLALFRSIKTDEPTGISRTFLGRYDAEKIDRLMLDTCWGSAIKFNAIAGSLTLGEGTETCAAAVEAGFTPAWALGSAGAIGFFPVLRKVRELTLLLENDATSRRNVSACLDRYRSAGRTVAVVQCHIGYDFGDCWKARHG
jgi:putative DNA primase/helicase